MLELPTFFFGTFQGGSVEGVAASLLDDDRVFVVAVDDDDAVFLVRVLRCIGPYVLLFCCWGEGLSKRRTGATVVLPLTSFQERKEAVSLSSILEMSSMTHEGRSPDDGRTNM